MNIALAVWRREGVEDFEPENLRLRTPNEAPLLGFVHLVDILVTSVCARPIIEPPGKRQLVLQVFKDATILQLAKSYKSGDKDVDAIAPAINLAAGKVVGRFKAA